MLFFKCSYSTVWSCSSHNQSPLIKHIKKIPEEYQRAIRDAAAKEFAALLDERPAIDEQALKDLKEYGIEVYIPSDDELASFAGYIRENVWPELENMFGAEFYHGLMKEFGLE